MESMSSATRRAKASLSFSRCWAADLLHVLLERRRGAADRQHLLGQAVRRAPSGVDGARGGRLDFREPIFHFLRMTCLERVAGRFGQASPRSAGRLGDGLTSPLGRMGRSFLHLDHCVDQRRAGFVAQARRFALRFGDRRGQGAQALSGGADALVQSGEQRARSDPVVRRYSKRRS